MITRFELFVLVLMAAVMPGCGSQAVTGGTKGVIHAGSALMGEFQVTVHQVEGSTTKPIGFGVTGSNGEFELVTNGAKGPLRLSPGEYRCTLESIGAPVVVPLEFTKADTTPLKVSWAASDKKLDLEIPTPQLRR